MGIRYLDEQPSAAPSAAPAAPRIRYLDEPQAQPRSAINPYGLPRWQDRPLTSKLLPPFSPLQLAFTPGVKRFGESMVQGARRVEALPRNAVDALVGRTTAENYQTKSILESGVRSLLGPIGMEGVPSAVTSFITPEALAKSAAYGPLLGTVGRAASRTPLLNTPLQKIPQLLRRPPKSLPAGLDEATARELTGIFSGSKRRAYLTKGKRLAEDTDIAERTALKTRQHEVGAKAQTQFTDLERRQLTEESSRALQEQQLIEEEARIAQQFQDEQFRMRSSTAKRGVESVKQRQQLEAQAKQIDAELLMASRNTLPALRKTGRKLYKAQSKAYEAGVEDWMQSAEANQIQITRNEMLSFLDERNPYRPDDVQMLVRDMFPEGTETTALTPRAIYQHIEDASRGISRSAKASGDYTWSNHLTNEKKWALLELAERKGAKGVVEAKANYASWAPTRKRLIRDVGIFRSNTEELDRGAKFLVRMAKDPHGDPRAFVMKVEEMSGVNFSDDLVQHVARLDSAQRGKAALQIGRVLAQEEHLAQSEQLQRLRETSMRAARARREGLRREGIGAKQRYAKESDTIKLTQQRTLADLQRESSQQAIKTINETRRLEDVKATLDQQVRQRRIKTAIAGILIDLATGGHVVGTAKRAAAVALQN